MAIHNDIGSWGERLAIETLVVKGYAIVEQNARIGHYEIDIVAMKGDRIVFVEVKTRSNADFAPTDAIDRKKINYLCRAANAYVKARNIPHEVQFDVITITGTPNDTVTQPLIEHYPDAFRPPLRGAR